MQAQDRGVRDWSTSSADQCTPTCRDGYECKLGECVPICSPECGPGLLCTSGGECVRIESAPAPSPIPQRTSMAACVPSCRAGFACLDGACVSACNPACARGEVCNGYGECVPESEQPPIQESVSAPDDAWRRSLVDVHADVAGAFQFGLSTTVEAGKRLSGYARVRAVNAGVASYFLIGRDPEDELVWGLGGTLGMHVFTAKEGNRRGFFGGPALEYVFVQTRDLTQDFASYRTHLLVPQADFGHRWGFRGFLLGLGVSLGVAIPVREVADPLGSTGCRRLGSCKPDLGVSFVPALVLDLGYFVPRY